MSDGSGGSASTRTGDPDEPTQAIPRPEPTPTEGASSVPQSEAAAAPKAAKEPKAPKEPKAAKAPKAPKEPKAPWAARVGRADKAPKPSEPGEPTEPGGRAADDREPLARRLRTRVATARDEHRASAAAKAEHTAATSSQAKPAAGPARAPRRARLRMTRIDPWSVMKTSFLLSIAFGVVTVVAVAMVWSVLDAAGVWDSINTTIQESVGGPDTADLDVENYVGTSRVLGFTMVVAAVDVVLITAIATLTAFLYNMSAALLGGVEVTLSEDQH